MHQIAWRGSAGEVRWVYARAASLGSWTVEGIHLSAVITMQDAFRLSQQPLTFVVPRPNGHVWSWPMMNVRIDGTTLHADLPPPEERSV